MKKKLNNKFRPVGMARKIKMMTGMKKFVFQEASNQKQSPYQQKNSQTILNKMKTKVTNLWQ
jgi:hypothetical protein